MAFRTNKMPVLQEKSASGAVATFNTALAMPLPSCKIAVNAWQEGSGDPNPIDNVRPIHGFSEVNATRCGINHWDEQWEIGAYNINTGEKSTNNNTLRNKHKIKVVENTTYFFRSGNTGSPSQVVAIFYDCYGNFLTNISGGDNYMTINNIAFTTPSQACYMAFYIANTTTYNNDISINYPSTDTDYHAYTGNTYTIQLGQEVYGAEVDVVNGVAHVTHLTYILPTIESFIMWYSRQTVIVKPPNIIPTIQSELNVYGDVLKATSLTSDDFACWHRYLNVIIIVPDDYTVADYNNNIAGTKIIYPLETPFDIQLTPTQIETLIGNNTIFADTGDVDLTFKDLDIAKRGNFREVFKLPS